MAALVLTSSSEEITIEVTDTETIVKTITLVIVPGSPGRWLVRSHDPVTRPSRSGESRRVDTAGEGRRAAHRLDDPRHRSPVGQARP